MHGTALSALLLLICALGSWGCDRLASRPSGLPPNIVLIISDDHGWPDFGFAGSNVVKTPNLDALARESVVIQHAFNSASACRPSLQTILTGFHPIQINEKTTALETAGVEIGEYDKMRHFETLPRLLAERGYASFQGGKFWEGTYEMSGFTHGMTDEVADRTPDAELFNRISGGAGLRLARETMQPLWDFIDEHRSQPFFVWFAPMLPHTPFDASEEFRAPYLDKGLNDSTLGYYSNITRFDARVGELLAYLESRQLERDTVVVFLADNGWQPVAGEAYFDRVIGGARGKMSLYELGFRTPLIFRWPGHIEPAVDERSLVSTVDLYATLLDIAGARKPGNRPGTSLVPTLTGKARFRRSVVAGRVEMLRGVTVSADTPVTAEIASFVRTRKWRYVFYQNRRREFLFRIGEDPYELYDVARQHPEVVKDLRKKLYGWRRMMLEFATRMP